MGAARSPRSSWLECGFHGKNRQRLSLPHEDCFLPIILSGCPGTVRNRGRGVLRRLWCRHRARWMPWVLAQFFRAGPFCRSDSAVAGRIPDRVRIATHGVNRVIASNNRKRKGSKGNQPPPVQVTFKAGGQAFQATATHFDENGLLILCPTPFPVGVKLEVQLHFAGLQNPVEVRGEVVWSNIFGPDDAITPRGMGVKFLTLESTTSRLLVDLSEKYRGYGDQYRCYYT